MSLELSQLHRLLSTPSGSVPVGSLPDAVCARFGCRLGIVYLSSSSLKHILAKHPDVSLMDMLHLPNMVQKGLWIADRPNSACVLYQLPESESRFASALKVTGDGFEPYVSSFYRVKKSQFRTKRTRGEILQEHR
jgi:hypothetical protein